MWINVVRKTSPIRRLKFPLEKCFRREWLDRQGHLLKRCNKKTMFFIFFLVLIVSAVLSRERDPEVSIVTKNSISSDVDTWEPIMIDDSLRSALLSSMKILADVQPAQPSNGDRLTGIFLMAFLFLYIPYENYGWTLISSCFPFFCQQTCRTYGITLFLIGHRVLSGFVDIRLVV